MRGSILGIDIGASQLKLAVATKGVITHLVLEDMPENMMRNGRIIAYDAMGDFLKEQVKSHGISAKHCAIILPEEDVFLRSITMPYMKPEQLRVNLPFEFHDFISDDKSKYVYDYAFISERETEDGGRELELLGAAAQKELIASYKSMLKRAGLKLKIAIPRGMAYSNIIFHQIIKNGGDEGRDMEKEYCFVDLAHTSCRVTYFTGRKPMALRIIDYGLNMLDFAIAENNGVDVHIARTWKESNYNQVLESEACKGIYDTIAIEIMRAMNFYRFNNPDSIISSAFLCGGGGEIPLLVEAIKRHTELELLSIDNLLQFPKEFNAQLELFISAIGATKQ